MNDEGVLSLVMAMLVLNGLICDVAIFQGSWL